MTLDLQKLTLHRLIDTQDQDFYSKLSSKYFTGINFQLFERIQVFYKAHIRLPSSDEFEAIRKDTALQEYLVSQILNEENKNDDVENSFLINQLQDFFIREETISFMDKLIDNLDDLEKIEIIDNFQNFLLDINKAIPSSDQLLDAGEMESLPAGDKFIMFPSGISNEYDVTNGGFGLQELVLLGGRRGSGKSIFVLNATLSRFLQGSTVVLFSIEMRYLEVYYRLISILSGVPFLNLLLNKVSPDNKYDIGAAKLKYFYEKSDESFELLKELKTNRNLQEFDAKIKIKQLRLKENRFLIIDEEDLSPNRIDHFCNTFSNKYPNFTMATVDYLNIVRVEDSRSWLSQISIADHLKSLSRKYNLTVLTPYQTDANMEARFAKGILDAADRAFAFLPKETQEDTPWKLPVFTTKIRNGRNITFDAFMDWECVKVYPEMTQKLLNKIQYQAENPEIESENGKLLPAFQYGKGRDEKDGTVERSKDI